MLRKDRKKDPRIDLINEVYCEVGQSEILARWTDISRGGIFVQTMHPPPLGEQTKLRVRLDQSQKFYRAVGIVRHRLEWVGMGLEFTQLHPGALQLIDGLLCLV
ncbi:MAG: hypothetical protein DMG06_01360 [Acidobacteria bacterium]|nr:MAG: hypothetical protein DMG06_01360 [Acidobacteriota bacterium]